MKDFLHRTITSVPVDIIDDSTKMKISATRTRTSEGFSSIVIKFGTQKIEFDSDS